MRGLYFFGGQGLRVAALVLVMIGRRANTLLRFLNGPSITVRLVQLQTWPHSQMSVTS